MIDVCVGIIFFAAASGKIYNPTNTKIFFEETVPTFAEHAQLTIRIVIVIELLLGVLLVSGIRPVFSRSATLVVLLAFTVFLLWAVYSGVTASCGCLTGIFVRETLTFSLWRNAELLIVTSIALFLVSSKKDVIMLRNRPRYTHMLGAIGLVFAIGAVASALNTSTSEDDFRSIVDGPADGLAQKDCGVWCPQGWLSAGFCPSNKTCCGWVNCGNGNSQNTCCRVGQSCDDGIDDDGGSPSQPKCNAVP